MGGALDRELRKTLAKAIRAARSTGEAGARAALGALRVGAGEPDPSMSAEERALRRRLRAHGRALGDQRRGDGQDVTRLAHEVAYEHWHRMLFARFLAENDLLIEPRSGVAVSLDECRELARERDEDAWAMIGGFAERMLPRIFRPDDPSFAVRLAPETQQALEKTLADLPAAVFRADDALGWTYQFWQADRKEEVNQSGAKIGADELPAVTQLFTERYMVRFLFHNTVGAWRAGKLLALRHELAAGAEREAALRRAVRLGAAGGYEFDYLRFVRESPDGQEDPDHPARWRPAAGSFAEWPRRAAALKILDPCCGSGHFLVEGLQLLVRLRMEEEDLPLEEAIGAVLRDNLHGLEIDPRCAQIAAFALAFAAWRLAGRVTELPPLNIACSGLAPNATQAEWLTLAERAAAAMDSAPQRGIIRTRDTLTSGALRTTFSELHGLFELAPTLGSLIDPHAAGASMFAARFDAVQPLLESLLHEKEAPPEAVERTVAAAGMLRAASLLAGAYSLVITNVPYLARGRQGATLRAFAEKNYRASKGDLATMFAERAFRWLGDHGAQAVVVPQNWLFLKTYRSLREDLLARRRWRFVARLGPGAFETIGGHVVNVALTILSAENPDSEWRMAGLDVSAPQGKTSIHAADKARLMRGKRVLGVNQRQQLDNPDARISFFDLREHTFLNRYAQSHEGLTTADIDQFVRKSWELSGPSHWVPFIQNTRTTMHYGGRTDLIHWENGGDELRHFPSAFVKGSAAWDKIGLRITQMHQLSTTLYTGEVFGKNAATLIPRTADSLAALYCYASSPGYVRAVRELDQTLKVTISTLVQVPFDIERWRAVAADRYPHGLPEPYSDDPTQWIFHGHPCGSVRWDSEAKRTAEGPTRTDATVLHVAVARLLGYRWPAERDSEMRLADEARTLAGRCQSLLTFADQDGIVCIPALRGEAAAADRLRSLLAAAYGDAWSGATEQRLLQETGAGARPAPNLDAWLRNHFFAEHCRLFHHRPFIWHVWDGLPDGFGALVHYHRLAGSGGEGRRTLESLTYSYLGDWLERQRAGQRQEIPGADAKLVAALELKSELEGLLAGEPPLDLVVRWKALHRQPIGWDPDINDGVRLNIRPFLHAELRKGGKKGAGILRAKPNIKWGKDRGKEPQRLRAKRKDEEPQEYRPRADFPWFWSCPGGGTEQDRTDFLGGPAFDGARWNDLHYTNATKRAARGRKSANG